MNTVNLTKKRYEGRPCRRHPENQIRFKSTGVCVLCVKASVNVAHRCRHARLKLECFEAYGGARCEDCGITDIDVLTLDHVGGGGNADRLRRFGNAHRGGPALYKALKAEGWPPGFAVVCFNHNTEVSP